MTETMDRPRTTNPTIGDTVRGRPITGADLVNGDIRKITPGTGDGLIYHVRDHRGDVHEMRTVTVTQPRSVKLAPKVVQEIGDRCRRCKYRGEKEADVKGVAVRVCDVCDWRASYPEKGQKVTYYPPKASA